VRGPIHRTVNPNDLIGRQLYLMEEFDRSIVELLLAFAEPNDVLLDIGAKRPFFESVQLGSRQNRTSPEFKRDKNTDENGRCYVSGTRNKED